MFAQHIPQKPAEIFDRPPWDRTADDLDDDWSGTTVTIWMYDETGVRVPIAMTLPIEKYPRTV